MDFQELFIWLAQEHHFWRLIWLSWHLLGAPWAPMAAPGGSWWIYHFLFDYPDVTSHARDVSSYSPCMVVCNVSSYSIMLLCRRILIFS